MSKLPERSRSLPPYIGTVAVHIRCNDHIMYTDTVDLAGIIVDFCIVKQMLLLFALNSVQIYNRRHRLLVESHI